jgi:hypothetical protein
VSSRINTLACSLAFTTLTAQAQQAPSFIASPADVRAVTEASLGYIDALYKADSTLVMRHVHPTLTKRGYVRSPDGSWREGAMSYQELLRLSARWNRSGTEAGPRSPRAVELLDVLDRTAATRVTAEWGTDFLLLSRYDDGWKIVSIVWQTPPKP